VGIPVHGSNAGEAHEQETEELKQDWYQFYCQAIAAGVDPTGFGDLTFTQIHAAIDAEKYRRYNDMYFNVAGIVSNMDDDGVRKALYGGDSGNPARGKLIQKMMRPYSPSFFLPEVVSTVKAKPIENLSARAAEGVMQAIEAGVVSDLNWLQIRPIWESIHATAKKYRP
jgi:hypothetical protein